MKSRTIPSRRGRRRGVPQPCRRGRTGDGRRRRQGAGAGASRSGRVVARTRARRTSLFSRQDAHRVGRQTGGQARRRNGADVGRERQVDDRRVRLPSRPIRKQARPRGDQGGVPVRRRPDRGTHRRQRVDKDANWHTGQCAAPRSGAGPIDGGFGVLVLKGEVWVKTRHGTVDLKEGNGTMIFGAKTPQKAAPWSDDRTKTGGRDDLVRTIAVLARPRAIADMT